MHISCIENALSGSGNGFALVMMKFLGAENTFFLKKMRLLSLRKICMISLRDGLLKNQINVLEIECFCFVCGMNMVSKSKKVGSDDKTDVHIVLYNRRSL